MDLLELTEQLSLLDETSGSRFVSAQIHTLAGVLNDLMQEVRSEKFLRALFKFVQFLFIKNLIDFDKQVTLYSI